MHPTKKRMTQVIENFYRILPLTFEAGSGHLDYSEAEINYKDNLCGTFNCIGGWYAIAKGLHESDQNLDFRHGAAALASDLGFSLRYDLSLWAENNPLIWGSHNGVDMFISGRAWNGAKTITDVIHHLEAVRERLPE